MEEARREVAAVAAVEAWREAMAAPGRHCKMAENRTASEKLRLRRRQQGDKTSSSGGGTGSSRIRLALIPVEGKEEETPRKEKQTAVVH